MTNITKLEDHPYIQMYAGTRKPGPLSFLEKIIAIFNRAPLCAIQINPKDVFYLPSGKNLMGGSKGMLIASPAESFRPHLEKTFKENFEGTDNLSSFYIYLTETQNPNNINCHKIRYPLTMSPDTPNTIKKETVLMIGKCYADAYSGTETTIKKYETELRKCLGPIAEQVDWSIAN